MLTDLLIGGTSACISRTLVAPLELYRLQRQNSFIPNSTMLKVYKKEGIRYFWKGNGVNCLRAFPQFAINYAIFEKSKKYNDTIFENKKISNFVSGCYGGLISMLCIYPLETTRTYLSLQTNKNKYTGITNILRTVKLRNLYKGSQMSMMGFGSWSGLQYTSYYLINEYMKNDYFNIKMISGGLSAMLAVTFTYPSDLIRRRLQLQGFDNTVPQYNGILDAVSKIKKQEGFKGFYRGLFANYLKTGPTFAIQFWCVELFKDYKQ
jgi:solute carrier family 25 (mitochondrial phosphate transporter), member 23/24/25/41